MTCSTIPPYQPPVTALPLPPPVPVVTGVTAIRESSNSVSLSWYQNITGMVRVTLDGASYMSPSGNVGYNNLIIPTDTNSHTYCVDGV